MTNDVAMPQVQVQYLDPVVNLTPTDLTELGALSGASDHGNGNGRAYGASDESASDALDGTAHHPAYVVDSLDTAKLAGWMSPPGPVWCRWRVARVLGDVRLAMQMARRASPLTSSLRPAALQPRSRATFSRLPAPGYASTGLQQGSAVVFERRPVGPVAVSARVGRASAGSAAGDYEPGMWG